ncbi:MAG: tRNA (N6-threonylcarbamoyladenosine(37)-N6)-methyltransferase TrmO [Gammaproteobacteria bacterium]|nr:MAG: tRNA (N6-threonylcarbamoyladenosine(37)-N6)-methyltransferase TrmO [Gammaproteobacteria bacterium]
MTQPTDKSLLKPIARVVSPYREKFGIPRQSLLVEEARGWLVMGPDLARRAAFEGLDGFSHIWVIFGFHACKPAYRLRVRPPRLGGNREVGVFASRSPFRPNNLGLSVLRFEGLEGDDGDLRLRVAGLDLLDGTPVYDIKPYLSYSDCVPDARSGYAARRPDSLLTVEFAPAAEAHLASLEQEAGHLRPLIVRTLALDPRPAYRQGREDARVYGMRLADLDVRWRVADDRIVVEEVLRVTD